MGLKIRSLARLPQDIDRSYFLYLLDYGWKEPLSRALHSNFDRMARFSSDHDAVVISRFDGEEFTNEVLSWHHINGASAENILPAILLTRTHPQKFKEMNEFAGRGADWRSRRDSDRQNDRMILLPLRDICKSETDVTDLLDRITRDVRDGKALSGFSIGRTMEAGKGQHISDALIPQPNFGGFGIDIKILATFLDAGISKVRTFLS